MVQKSSLSVQRKHGEGANCQNKSKEEKVSGPETWITISDKGHQGRKKQVGRSGHGGGRNRRLDSPVKKCGLDKIRKVKLDALEAIEDQVPFHPTASRVCLCHVTACKFLYPARAQSGPSEF